jgi:cytochrome b involved in lipid metabolism
MKKLFIGILIIAAVIGAIYYFGANDTNQADNTNNSPTNDSNSNQVAKDRVPESNSNVKTYTIEEVRKHGPETWDTGDSSLPCWMVIRGKVYEIPDSFTETHPGGHVIYEGCGTDATTYFESRPQGSGTPHSANARAILEKYYIGDLK